MCKRDITGRNNISTPNEYFEQFRNAIPSLSPWTIDQKTPELLEMANKLESETHNKRKEALERAWKNRDFEIQLYWSRAACFWTFIAATFAGYFVLISSKDIELIKIYPQIELIIICLGFIFSLAWHFVNKGSKYWQESWEDHIDMLEDDFTGPIYKMVKKSKGAYSVSRINGYVSKFVSFVWIIIFIAYFFHHYSNSINLPSYISISKHLCTIITTFIIVLVTVIFSMQICYSTKARTGMGKKYFQRRISEYKYDNK